MQVYCFQEGSKESVVTHLAEELYYKLNSVDCFRNDLIIDNRYNMTIGRRLLEARRIGYPFIVVIGRKALQPVPEFEVHNIMTDVETSINVNAITAYLKECLLNK
jgi:prolyl-tRNA synthetase